jgi:hypothetical protein
MFVYVYVFVYVFVYMCERVFISMCNLTPLTASKVISNKLSKMQMEFNMENARSAMKPGYNAHETFVKNQKVLGELRNELAKVCMCVCVCVCVCGRGVRGCLFVSAFFSVCVFLSVSVCVCPCMDASVCVCLYLSESVRVFVYRSVFDDYVCVCVCVSVCFCICACLFVCLCLALSVCVCL